MGEKGIGSLSLQGREEKRVVGRRGREEEGRVGIRSGLDELAFR